ncbi:aspartate kinase [Gudongella sp. DL1XJH-153]|uniref:aspartate kinase n=1 Tax=Gudongella sp. DL1XJH-153 TaxID=3409804 RepID=UPI003BB5D40A
MIVAKFGGSSLADSQQFIKVKNIVTENPDRRIVVPSAPGKRHGKDHKVTDLLYMCHQLSSHNLHFDEVFQLIRGRYEGICKDLNLEIDIESILDQVRDNISKGASRDYCASRGEYINGLILADYLGAEFIDATEVIRFNARGVLNEIETEKLVEDRLLNAERAVVPGFYGADEDGSIITFSRGGSDVTGSIIANGIGAKLYENWTDVSGFLKADPKVVHDPLPIREITYKELRELSYMGAPVLHEEAIFPVRTKGIPIQIRNTNKPEDPGTLIVNDNWSESSPGIITGLAGKKDFTVISVEKTQMTAEKGFLRKLVSVFEANDVTIEHMPSSIDSISVIVSDKELNGKLSKLMEEIRIYCNPDNIAAYSKMALLAVVGRGMINTKGVSSKVFTALYKDDINIRMISQGSSELNILIGIENDDFDKSVRAIYNAFNEKEAN